MKTIVASLAIGFGFISLGGCSFMLQQPTPNAQKQPDTPKLQRNTEMFTGKVVMVDGAYRLSLASNPKTLLRLTRAGRESDFAKQQILLRKYYEKTITVNGTLKDDWIFRADITGQYVPPGGDTGPNMNAPKETRP